MDFPLKLHINHGPHNWMKFLLFLTQTKIQVVLFSKCLCPISYPVPAQNTKPSRKIYADSLSVMKAFLVIDRCNTLQTLVWKIKLKAGQSWHHFADMLALKYMRWCTSKLILGFQKCGTLIIKGSHSLASNTTAIFSLCSVVLVYYLSV